MAPPDPGAPNSGPLPPADFANRDLPIDILAVGTRLVRIHRSEVSLLFFGATGGNRFDDPAGRYGVCYLARTLEGAFAETCLRVVGARFVAWSFLEARSLSVLAIAAPVRLVSVHGPGLARVGATGAVTSGPHPVSRQWSRAVHEHPAAPDGIAYRSNHDDGELCIALFERARDRLAPAEARPLTADRARLAALLARYDVGLG